MKKGWEFAATSVGIKDLVEVAREKFDVRLSKKEAREMLEEVVNEEFIDEIHDALMNQLEG